mgnify:CR=1 FL=1
MQSQRVLKRFQKYHLITMPQARVTLFKTFREETFIGLVA